MYGDVDDLSKTVYLRVYIIRWQLGEKKISQKLPLPIYSRVAVCALHNLVVYILYRPDIPNVAERTWIDERDPRDDDHEISFYLGLSLGLMMTYSARGCASYIIQYNA